ncbi:DMT family transporter [Pontibacter sp. JAM-7]|uniref:DMT family transporter n=1 Tax=Pontibacter sp. JAM-7 TaxID=3366581 RepID=UPI003AF5C112
MSVPAAYLAVIAIWSTTPLGISWSSASLGPELATLSRILLALPMVVMVAWVLGIRMSWRRDAWVSYGIGGLMVFAPMYCTYIAAGYLPSGLISLFWGMTPLLSALLARPLLGDRITPALILSLLLGAAGLGIIFAEELVITVTAWPGVALLSLGVALYSLCAVLLKRVDSGVHPINQTAGALLVALPCYGLTWWLNGAEAMIWNWQDRGTWAVIYLALIGSVVGFFCYFYILQHLRASSVALITLICPVFALLLGHLLNAELVTLKLLVGACMIGLALACYHWGGRIRWHLLVPLKA